MYCVSVLVALLTVGSLSDHVGRRPVICGALLVEAASMVVFLRADGVTALITARTLQGLATGAATSALGAALLDVSRRRGSVVVSVAPLLGMSAGTLGTSFLLHAVPMWSGAVYAVLLAAMAAQIVGLAFLPGMPGTGRRKPGSALWSLRPRVHAPAATRRTLLLVAPVFVAVWALAGFYLSLGPALVEHIAGSASSSANGLIVCTLTASAVTAVMLTRSMPAEQTVSGGSLCLAGGVAVTLAASADGSGTLLYAGTALAGAGFGPAFQGGLRMVTARSAAHERAGLMAAVYVITYLAMSVPVLAAGVLVQRYGLIEATMYFGAFVMVLALVPLVGLRMLPGNAPADSPLKAAGDDRAAFGRPAP